MPDTVAQAGAYLHHVAFESANPERLAAFYGDAMQLEVEKISETQWRCEGPARRMIVLNGEDQKLGFSGLAVRDADGLEMIRERARSQGVEILDSPSPYFEDGAFAVRDYDGHLVAFGLSKAAYVKTMGWPRANAAAPIWGPVQHMTYRTQNIEGFYEFYHKKLGFRMVDRVVRGDGSIATIFVTSNHEHHTIAAFDGDRTGMDHHSYEAGEWNYLRDWCEHFASKGIQLMWGPGRHGPGHNLFAFIADPDGNWIEISAELEVIHDRPCEDWPHEARSLNTWGKAILRS